jgi:hypothetical protein
MDCQWTFKHHFYLATPGHSTSSDLLFSTLTNLVDDKSEFEEGEIVNIFSQTILLEVQLNRIYCRKEENERKVAY